MRRGGVSDDLARFLGLPAAMGFLLAALGFVVWIGISALGGLSRGAPGFHLREAWDTPTYFYFGVPLMVAAVALAAFLRPARAWRWAAWLVAGHQLGMFLAGVGMQSGVSLAIATLMLAAILGTLFTIPAMLGALAAQWRPHRAW